MVINIIVMSTIVFVALLFITEITFMIEDKIKEARKIKWAKEFMNKVEKFQI